MDRTEQNNISMTKHELEKSVDRLEVRLQAIIDSNLKTLERLNNMEHQLKQLNDSIDSMKSNK